MITRQASVFVRWTVRDLLISDEQIKHCDWKGEIILKVWDIRQTSRFSHLFIFHGHKNAGSNCST